MIRETFAYGMSKDLVCKKEINSAKLINFDYATKDKVKEHNPNWPQNPGHPDRIFIIGGLDQEKKRIASSNKSQATHR